MCKCANVLMANVQKAEILKLVNVMMMMVIELSKAHILSSVI